MAKDRKPNLDIALKAAYKLLIFNFKEKIQSQNRIIESQQKLIDIYQEYFNFMERRYPV